MLKSQSPLRIPIDQFTKELPNGSDRILRPGQVWLAVPGLVVGLTAGILHTSMSAISTPVLTVTSILTGFTFSMAVVFWNKSIEARRDPAWAVRNEALDLIDSTRTHLIYTVIIGVINVLIALITTILNATPSPAWMPLSVASIGQEVAVGLTTGLSIYLVCLVAQGLRIFGTAFFVLRR